MGVTKKIGSNMGNEFRELIDEKFKSINSKMDAQHEINQLQFATIIEKANKKEEKIEELYKTVQGIINLNSTHYVNCPNTKKIEDIKEYINDEINGFKEYLEEQKDENNKRLLELDFFRKYPKAFLVGLALVIIITWIEFVNIKTSVGSKIPMIESFEKKQKAEQERVDKETQSILHNK